ncbi:MAG: hypothetical protein RL062_710, partial [Bacteroidota bacterium]
MQVFVGDILNVLGRDAVDDIKNLLHGIDSIVHPHALSIVKHQGIATVLRQSQLSF